MGMVLTGQVRREKPHKKDLGDKELQKKRQSRNQGQEPTRGKPWKSSHSRNRKSNSSGSRKGETQSTERMNWCAALPWLEFQLLTALINPNPHFPAILWGGGCPGNSAALRAPFSAPNSAALWGQVGWWEAFPGAGFGEELGELQWGMFPMDLYLGSEGKSSCSLFAQHSWFSCSSFLQLSPNKCWVWALRASGRDSQQGYTGIRQDLG